MGPIKASSTYRLRKQAEHTTALTRLAKSLNETCKKRATHTCHSLDLLHLGPGRVWAADLAVSHVGSIGEWDICLNSLVPSRGKHGDQDDRTTQNCHAARDFREQ